MRTLVVLLLIAGCARNSPGLVQDPHDRNAAAPGVATPGHPAAEDDLPIPIASEDPVWGSRDAAVTIVEFSDFECAACAEMEIEIDDLKREYGTTGLRVVFKNFPDPIHPNARPAAEAAQGVMVLGGSQAFWTFHELAFTTEDELSQGRYEEWAALAGADVHALRAGLDGHTWTSKIDADVALVTKLGASRPPAIWVNGARVEDIAELPKVTQTEQIKAQRELQNGIAASQVYRVMSLINQGTNVSLR